MAAFNGRTEIAQALVQAGANLEAKNDVGPHAQGGHCADMEGVEEGWDSSCPWIG